MGDQQNGRVANFLLVATVVMLLTLTAVLIVAAIAAI